MTGARTLGRAESSREERSRPSAQAARFSLNSASALPLGYEPMLGCGCTGSARLDSNQRPLQSSACRVRAGGREKRMEPTSGVEPDPPGYKTGARPFELRGRRLRERLLIVVTNVLSRKPLACEVHAVEPTSGIEPEPPVYEAGARPIELRGQVLAVHASSDRRQHAGASG